jgi:hypothetical protein
MRVLRLILVAVLLGGSALATLPVRDTGSLHEWGTFTSLQDESGATISWMNSDDEPVPQFVHRLSLDLLVWPQSDAPVFYQGAPACHPDVTIRLETPVVYFHPAPGAPVSKVDVKVAFQGGWLTEYYPDARIEPEAEAFRNSLLPHVTEKTRGVLEWKGLCIGASGGGPETEDRVWLAPRKVDAADVATPAGERERFLFYRGVGRHDAPLRIARDGGTLNITSQWPRDLEALLPLRISSAWLLDVRPNGRSAFRPAGPIELTKDAGHVVATLPGSFMDSDYSDGNLRRLRAEMKASLVGEGLFGDEAEALLNTWELSYFRSPGLRFFFMVPRAWTDRVLPLEVSPAMEIRRAMVGRIELVIPAQRLLLAKIAKGPIASAAWHDEGLKAQILRKPIPPVPPEYQAYEDLGRLRRVLILDEEKRRSTWALRKFITEYGLQAAEVGEKKEE